MLHGECLRQRLQTNRTIPLIGVFDSFSASLAARHFDGIFVSGFGLAASYYGLPDTGFVAWPDVVDLTRRIRAVAPDAYVVVDIDDGFADSDVAARVARQLELSGASGLILEDQARPRKCGHFGGKKLLPLDVYLERLNSILEACSDIVVIARTDASDESEIRERVAAFSCTGADAILVDGQSSLESISQLRELTDKPMAFNQILGGRSPAFGLSELQEAGISLAILSTPLLFAAQAAMERCLEQLSLNDMRLDAVETTVQLSETQQVLMANWKTSRTITSHAPRGSTRLPRAVRTANGSDPACSPINQSEKTDEF